MQEPEQLDSGWTVDLQDGSIYHFEHVLMDFAKQKAQVRDELHVVETINWTLADDDTCHYNRYFALNMASAIAVAVKFEIMSSEVEENVVGIRPATEEEIEVFWKAEKYFEAEMPNAIPD